jgi:lysozyme
MDLAKTIRNLLMVDTAICAQVVNDRVTVNLTQNQFDALVSFCFNVGGDNFANSTLIKKLNLGLNEQVEIELQRWVKSNGVVNPGLVNRRRKEIDLFKHSNY